jgi:hypothetical protein
MIPTSLWFSFMHKAYECSKFSSHLNFSIFPSGG